ncbi:hypothetical protein [Halovibrio sp. HP20-50]|uniref:hypothetical protein n=1 Tax=Halovibrio sp. HP20-59 TaxID=3080275 RepID=UPI00294B7437|nr:hypothetical protein [Halovibrio sp. HP20-59]MEA2119301.1 hypothetical protein [Halovibrio sp. HP20-59]
MWKQIGMALFASWLPLSGFAAEPVDQPTPEIAGSLDGERREWFILSRGNDSNASFVELGDDINIDITGSVDDEVWEGEEALLISLTVNEAQLSNAVVLHPIGASISPPLFTSEGGNVAVTLTDYERTNHMIHVAGKIEGLLALQIELGEPPSQEEGIEIDVSFDVEAQKIEY